MRRVISRALPARAAVDGPVDSFKAWASATLFEALAIRSADDELRSAASEVLRHFTGGMVYWAEGRGSAGYTADEAMRRSALEGRDAVTSALVAAALDQSFD